MSNSHWERFHCNVQNVTKSCSMMLLPEAKTLFKEKNFGGGGVNRGDKVHFFIYYKDKNTYTKAPPALPNLVTLPFPNELFISFIAASSAFCWRRKKVKKLDLISK